MIIRLAKLADKQQVLRVLDELGEEVNQQMGYSPHNKEAQKVGGAKFEEVVRRKDTLIFVATENHQIVGVLSLYFLPNMRHGYELGHIEDLVVSEKVRRKGVGTKLLTA